MSNPLIIEICPHEGRASMCLANGESVVGYAHWSDIDDCASSGDCEDACAYVRDHIGVDFRIVARNAAGDYENRLSTPEEMTATARAIYFESESDFTDADTAALYLIWQAASDAVCEAQAGES